MNTKQLRLKIIDLAINGELVPQDPNDEHASVLLERIHLEKERPTKSGKIKAYKRSPSSNKYLYGPLPNGWEVTSISDVCIVNPRNTVENSMLVSFVPMTLVEGGFSNRFTFKERTWEKVKKGFNHFKDGDVGLAKITPCLENRKSVVFRGLTNGIGAGTSELLIFRPFCHDTILPEYLLWFFKSERFICGCIGAFSGAVGQQRVGKDYVAAIQLPIPPFSEQCRIVSMIESTFAIIDEIEQSTTTLQSAVDAAKSKILSLAIIGKLVPQNPSDKPASDLLECIREKRKIGINAGKIKRSKSGTTTPVCVDSSYFTDIPNSWEVCHLKDIGDIIGGGTPRTSEPSYWKGNIPWITPADLSGYSEKYISSGSRRITVRGLSESSATLMPAGSVLFSSRAPIGYCVISTCEVCTNQGFKSIVPVILDMNEWVYYFLRSQVNEIRSRASGTTFKEISAPAMGKTIITIPPLAEQKRIVKAIETAFELLESIANALT
jgi:type I restriction enzyme S subunit